MFTFTSIRPSIVLFQLHRISQISLIRTTTTAMAPRSQVRLLKAFFEEAQEEFITVVADSAGLKRWLQSFLLVGTQEQNHEIMERLIQYRQSHPGPPVPCTNPLLELIQNVLNALPDSEIASIEASQLLKDMFLDTYLPSTTGFGQKVGMLNSLIRLRQR